MNRKIVIDSAIYEENGMFFRFLKSEAYPTGIILQKGETLTGEYTTIEAKLPLPLQARHCAADNN
jgi:hypothetical protein